MKHFRIEPTYKKSVVEYTVFRRPLDDLTGNEEDKGKFAYLRKELGWRWGSFRIDVPETEEEIKEFLEERGGYDSVAEYLADYWGDEDIIVESTTLEEYLLPSTEDDFVDLTEDYEAEMIDCWDGCWEEFIFYGPNWTEESQEELEASWEENQESDDGAFSRYEFLEDNGWESIDCNFQIHGGVIVEESEETVGVTVGIDEEDETIDYTV